MGKFEAFIVNLLFRSKGVMRTLASIFATLAAMAPSIPPLAPYAEILIKIAGILGGIGVAKYGAAQAGLVKSK